MNRVRNVFFIEDAFQGGNAAAAPHPGGQALGVLRAEGERFSRILQAQGLRILSPGSRPLSKEAITVFSLDALKLMADGQATKIIFPFEVSSLIKQLEKEVESGETIEELKTGSFSKAP